MFGDIALAAPPITNGEGLAILIDFSTSVGVLWHRCVVRQRVSYLSCRKRSGGLERYNGHVQLMSFPDCLVLLIILSKWVQSIFLPVPGLLFVLTCRRDAACSNSPDFPLRLSTQYALRKHKSHSSVKA